MGKNDCGCTEADNLEAAIETVFDADHDLQSKVSAKNFVFVDIPPIGCSPQGTMEPSRLASFLRSNIRSSRSFRSSNEVKERVEVWNELLKERATAFGSEAKRRQCSCSRRTSF